MDDDSPPGREEPDDRRRRRSPPGDAPGRPAGASSPRSDPAADPDSNSDSGEQGPPEELVAEAERLTRLAREADGEEAAAYRRDRDERLADSGFTARVRREDAREVLVVHPADWVEDGTIRPDRVDDLDRAVERPLSGAGDPDDWAAVAEQNRRLAAEVREEHGQVHGENALALAEFMSNHYAKPVERATGEELREFLEEYFPRNAFPTDEQRAAVGRSVELTFEAAGESLP